MALPKAVISVLRVAPTLLAALGGPLAAAAAAVATTALSVWLGQDDAKRDGSVTPPTPEAIVQVVQENADNPEFLLALKQAENDLRKFEREAGFKFAELAVRDRESARAFVRDTGSAEFSRKIGTMSIVWDGVVTLGILAGAFVLMAGVWPITDPNVFAALMSFVGVIMGRVSSRADTYYNFIFGSSQSSQDKSDQIADTVADLGAALADARPPPALPLPAPLPAPVPPPVVVAPVPPVLPAPALPKPSADWMQGPFGGVRWRLTPRGVLLEGSQTPLRTIGVPATTRRIWKDFGPLIAHSCINNEVPMEIVVACIATESRGKPKAFLVEPDKRVSVGLMQTLTGTASEVMGREVSAQDLNDPALSIEAGTRYIARQRPKTGCQPPLVAAAYNAGGLYRARPGDDNPFNLRSTGDHILRFCGFFGDAVTVAVEDKWQQITTDAAA